MGTREILLDIYNGLYEEFGNQGWWPVSDNHGIPKYFQQIKTHNHRFEIILGAILTQNTSWKNVEKALINLNKKKLMDIKKIKEIPLNNLKKLIRSSGYFNQKAPRLKTIAQFLEKNPHPSRSELLEVNGIGPETADSILLYAFNQSYFVVDAYTKRIMDRVGFKFKDYNDLQNLFMSNLPKESKLYNEYHALLVKLGKDYCTKSNPRCTPCPLLKICKFGNKSTGI